MRPSAAPSASTSKKTLSVTVPPVARIVARRGDDHLSIGVAMRLAELGVARWEPPPCSAGAWS